MHYGVDALLKITTMDQLPKPIADMLKAQQEHIKKAEELNISIIRKYSVFREMDEIRRLFWQPIIRFKRNWLHYNGSSERFLRGVKDANVRQSTKTPNGAV